MLLPGDPAGIQTKKEEKIKSHWSVKETKRLFLSFYWELLFTEYYYVQTMMTTFLINWTLKIIVSIRKKVFSNKQNNLSLEQLGDPGTPGSWWLPEELEADVDYVVAVAGASRLVFTEQVDCLQKK